MLGIKEKAASIPILLACLSCAQADIDPDCPAVFRESTSWKIESVYGDPSIFRASFGERAYVLGRDELAPFWPEPELPQGVGRLEPSAFLEIADPLTGLQRSLEERCGIRVTIGHRLPEIAPEHD